MQGNGIVVGMGRPRKKGDFLDLADYCEEDDMPIGESPDGEEEGAPLNTELPPPRKGEEALNN